MPALSIDLGRQLFVDDYLLAETSCTRNYHAARVHEASPVLVPHSPVELNEGLCPCACPFNDGVWFDPHDHVYKLWYHAGWFDAVAMATSRDGIHWERPNLDVMPGTNIVMRQEGARRDGCLVWLDSETSDPAQRFKMFLYYRYASGSPDTSSLYTSPDGIHWNWLTHTPPCGDNSSFYYDPFRRKFVMSIRRWGPPRVRDFYQASTFVEAGHWPPGGPVPWLSSDAEDKPDPQINYAPSLYDFNATPYESLMLGVFAIFYGPENDICARTGQVKIIDLHLGFSRDGFQWSRPQQRQPFLQCTRKPGEWNYGYLHAAGGICCVLKEELRFYFGAFSGQSVLPPGKNGAFEAQNKMYAGGSTGLAVLRRDGFASLGTKDSGTVLTKPMVFSGGFLFVNAAANDGEIRVEVLDESGQLIPNFSAQRCQPVQMDSSKQHVQWPGANLQTLAGRPVRFRFLVKNAQLFSFWVSAAATGESKGYLAAGGADYRGFVDQAGR